MNFFRAKKELRNEADKESSNKYSTKKGIMWHFNPPSFPHLGGV